MFEYILECMAYGISALFGGTDKPLRTTGCPLTWKDVGVGLCGWVVVFLIFCAVVFFFRYKKKQRCLNEKGQDIESIDTQDTQ